MKEKKKKTKDQRGGKKEEWSTSETLKASILKPHKAFKVQSLIYLPLSSSLVILPFFSHKKKSETWMQPFDVANSFHHQAIDRGTPCTPKHTQRLSIIGHNYLKLTIRPALMAVIMQFLERLQRY